MQQNPTLWPGWDTIRLIGRGSFGSVYEIRRTLIDGSIETSALKVISIPQNEGDVEEMYSEGYDSETVTATFRSYLKNIVSEYSLMKKMSGCANIVNCRDLDYVQHEDGVGWDVRIRMELLTPLTKALPEAISEETAIRLGRDIANALVLCKKHDIVHRDIKPQNIFVSPNGDFKLGDFGIAKTIERTMGGTKIGTYKYMAPEVYNNQPYGTSADIYSLGLVLYWMLNERRLPFLPLPPEILKAGADEQARFRRLSGEPIPAPAHGSEELKRIVLKACAYKPEDRYSSAADLLRDLSRVGSAPAVPTPEEPDNEGTVGLFMRREPMPEAVPEDERTIGVFSKPAPAPEKQPQSPPVDDATMGLSYAKPQPAAPAQQPAKAAPAQPAPASAPAAPAEPAQPKKRRNGLVIAVIIVGVLIAAAIIGAVVVIKLNPCMFGHDWSNATCTDSAICRVCGAEGESKLGHNWSKASCTEPQKCRNCGEIGEPALGHSWSAATCTDTQVCQVCGEIGESPLGHRWVAATCTDPEICLNCGEINAPATGHNWSAATCTKPEKCQICGETGSPALGHDWIAATYDTPQTCARCGEQTGNVKGYIGYVYGQWGDKRISIRDTGEGSYYELTTPIARCRKLTMELTVTECSGYPYGDWYLYAQDLNGKWSAIGTLEIPKESVGETRVIPYTFDSPVQIKALALVRKKMSQQYSISYDIKWYDAQEYVD